MINNVTLVGRLTKELELRKTNTNKSVVSFTLAMDRGANNGADFVNCEAWGQSAEFLCKYAKKGVYVALNGRIATDQYEKNGQKVFITKVVAEKVGLPRNSEQKPQSNYQQTLGGDVATYTDFENTASVNIEADDLPFY